MDIVTFLNNFKFRNELWILILPVSLMAIDFITGLLYAWSTNTFKSKKMRSGLTKKVGEIAILVIGELRYAYPAHHYGRDLRLYHFHGIYEHHGKPQEDGRTDSGLYWQGAQYGRSRIERGGYYRGTEKGRGARERN